MDLSKLKHNAVVLIFLAIYPYSNARTISRLVGIDYETTRKYLRELTEMGLIAKTSSGYDLTAHALSTLKSAEKPRLKRGKTAFLDSTTTTINNDSINIDSVVVEVESAEKPRLKRGKTALSEQGQINLEAMKTCGIGENRRTRALAEMEHVNPEYIRASVARSNGRGLGLAITMMEQGEETQEVETGKLYISGKYEEFIDR